jgi:hydroxyacylglutathione hydrolase
MEISPEELADQLASGRQKIIIDVRSRFEYLSGHLPGAIHLPFWQIPFRLSQLAIEKDSSLIIYCEHGPRALLARKILNLSGYINVFCLKGHMGRWRREERPVEL